jgi:uncharacterized protein with PIN domain
MTYRLLADENVERPLVYKLRNYGHDVEYVDELGDHGKDTDDLRLAAYTKREDRLLLTYDNDFVHDISESELRGVLFVQEESAASGKIADAVDRMAEFYPQDEVHGVEYVDNWL